ncbi:MAG TPA: cell division protein ZapA [Gemmatimonadaceae bacterium]|jgi:cell division protein ZapA (FtsZ GTPase activity inhibitor)|nr:cell division protein ZapA [Gemmatimonadaceae bacterium]
MATKKNTTRVTILNEEYNLRTDTSPEHAREVAEYLDQAIRRVMSSGAVVESNRAVVLTALQITAELFDARAALDANNGSIQAISDYVRPLLPPAKRHATSHR